MVRDISSPNSPASRKRSALDVVHKLKKWKQTPIKDKIDDVIVELDHDNDDNNKDIGGQFHVSPWKDTSIKSTFEATSTLDVNANISNMNVIIDSGAQLWHPLISRPEKTDLIYAF